MAERAFDVSIIIPVLNEEDIISSALSDLATRAATIKAEIILVDGGSEDNTLSLAMDHSVTVIKAPSGRSSQMNAGASVASGTYLVFLHIDTRLPDSFSEIAANWVKNRPRWGFFTVRLSSPKWPFRIIEAGINLRSRLTGTGTGDQVFYCHRKLYDEIGGYPEIPLMEDVVFCQKLNKLTAPDLISLPVTTSSRRWEEQGICRTVLLMWVLRIAFYCGVSPNHLARIYYSRA